MHDKHTGIKIMYGKIKSIPTLHDLRHSIIIHTVESDCYQ